MEAILADSLIKRYEGVCVLDGATLSVAEGARTVVSGPTGAGKSTFLFLIAGLLRPDSGCVNLFGQSASGNGCFMPPEARSIGMVFQRSLLWPHMTAGGNVEFALFRSNLTRRERKHRAREALALFGVESLESRRPETLSGGQAQRVALARSIAASPRILLWDEPFTGLDDQMRSDLAARAVEYMKRARTTLVAVSHHRDDAVALMADCVAICGGKIAPLA